MSKPIGSPSQCQSGLIPFDGFDRLPNLRPEVESSDPSESRLWTHCKEPSLTHISTHIDRTAGGPTLKRQDLHPLPLTIPSAAVLALHRRRHISQCHRSLDAAIDALALSFHRPQQMRQGSLRPPANATLSARAVLILKRRVNPAMRCKRSARIISQKKVGLWNRIVRFRLEVAIQGPALSGNLSGLES